MNDIEFTLENIDGQRFEDFVMAFLPGEGMKSTYETSVRSNTPLEITSDIAVRYPHTTTGGSGGYHH
jgi:hypothetical protein